MAVARSEKQKLKLLYLKQILEEQTDENHPITTQQLVEQLAEKGIRAVRRSIYSDMACHP